MSDFDDQLIAALRQRLDNDAPEWGPNARAHVAVHLHWAIQSIITAHIDAEVKRAVREALDAVAATVERQRPIGTRAWMNGYASGRDRAVEIIAEHRERAT